MTKITMGERMTKMETTLDYLKDGQEELKHLIECGLDKKADKQELDDLKERMKEKHNSNFNWANLLIAGLMALLTIINLVNLK